MVAAELALDPSSAEALPSPGAAVVAAPASSTPAPSAATAGPTPAPVTAPASSSPALGAAPGGSAATSHAKPLASEAAKLEQAYAEWLKFARAWQDDRMAAFLDQRISDLEKCGGGRIPRPGRC